MLCLIYENPVARSNDDNVLSKPNLEKAEITSGIKSWDKKFTNDRKAAPPP